MPAVISKQRLILVTHMEVSNKEVGTMFQLAMKTFHSRKNLNRIASKPVVSPKEDTYFQQSVFQLTHVFQENFPTNTQVQNSLCHRNDH